MSKTYGYVLLSGGIDSTTAVSEAINTVGRTRVKCVSIDYGQRHIRELKSAAAVAKFYGRPHSILPVNIPNSMLTNPGIPVPEISYSEIKGVSPTYVPFRNGLMLATLTSHIVGIHYDPTKDGAEDFNPENVFIYFGAHAEDAAGWAYPDCSPEFIGAMSNAVYIGTYHKVRLVVPFAYMMKDQIIKRGAELKTPYHLTFSCYKGGEDHCGVCSTCISRREAFKKAGVNDPTIYLA